MKKIYSLLGAVFMLCCLFNSAFAQDPAPASAQWSFVKPATEGTTGEEVTNTGAVTGVMTLQNMRSNGYVTNDNPLINTLRYRPVAETQFPANQTDIIPDVYIQFAVSPASGQVFNMNSLTYDIGSQGSTNAFRTKVMYSTSSDFANPIQVAGATGNVDEEGNSVDIVTRDAFKSISKELDVTVNSGETVYIRFYPWMHDAATNQTGKYLVLRNVTVAGTTVAADDEDPGNEEPTVAKKVAYVTYKKDMDPTAAATENDPIIRMLEADENIDLTVIAVETADGTADLTGFNVVVVQEGFGSGDAILKPGGSLALSAITVPFLYNKTYALRNGRAVVAGGGASAEGTGLAITVPEANREHELFNGITFTDGAFNVFKSAATDLGAEGTKTFNFTSGLTLSAGNTLLGSAPEMAAGDAATTIFLNDIPSGTTIGDQTIQARMIAVGMNTGAIAKDNGTNMTAEGLTLWRNAVYSLAGLEVPTTLVDPGVVTSIKGKVAGSTFSLSQNYPNPFNSSTTIQYEIKKSGYVALEVYDALGRKVATLADGNQAAGTYEVKLNKNLSNGMYFYKLSADGSSLTRRMLVTQ